MKRREGISSCYGDDMSSALAQICSQDYIEDAYIYGIRELSKYISINNPELLDFIFLQHVKEIENIEWQYGKVKLLDKLYIDNFIDKTGKLIVKADSQ